MQVHHRAHPPQPQRSFSHSSTSTAPPEYPSDVHPPPQYNSRPAPNEDTLLAGAVPPPEGIYTRRSKNIVIALPGQEQTVDVPDGDANDPKKMPKYGKGAVISGVVELKEGSGLKLAEVIKVTVQIQGKMKLEIAEGGQTTQPFLTHEIPLHDSTSTSTNPSRPQACPCPSMLPFSFTLPQTFTEDPPPIPPPPNPGPVQRPLPPTYTVHYDGIPGVRAEVKYVIKVCVERKRFLGLKKVQIVRIPFTYAPRSRPHVPGPQQFASFIAALKHAPEDWAAFVNDVPRRTDPTNREVQHVKEEVADSGEVITSALVLPSSQTFPLTQAIPFHLQLSVSPPSTPSSTPQQLPSRSPSRSRPPISTSSKPTSPTLLSLFSDPVFAAPPRGRIPGRPDPPPIVGLGEGMAAEGTMYGDPRYANAGRGELRDGLGTRGAELARRSGSLSRRDASVVSRREDGRGRKGGDGEDEEKRKSYVRVFLQRQVVVIVKGQKVVKTIACGEGRLHRVQLDNPPSFCEIDSPCSPTHSDDYAYECSQQGHHQVESTRSQSPLRRPPVPLCSPAQRDGVHYIAWEGYVLPSKEILNVGGFRTSALWVKDFITLTMIPPDPERSPLRALHHAVPVKLVSDPWEEEWWGGRRM